jgi:hypothetical protein
LFPFSGQCRASIFLPQGRQALMRSFSTRTAGLNDGLPGAKRPATPPHQPPNQYGSPDYWIIVRHAFIVDPSLLRCAPRLRLGDCAMKLFRLDAPMPRSYSTTGLASVNPF